MLDKVLFIIQNMGDEIKEDYTWSSSPLYTISFPQNAKKKFLGKKTWLIIAGTFFQETPAPSGVSPNVRDLLKRWVLYFIQICGSNPRVMSIFL